MKRITLLYSDFLDNNIPGIINYFKNDKPLEVSPFYSDLNNYKEYFDKNGYIFDYKNINDYEIFDVNAIYVYDLMRVLFMRGAYDLHESTVEQLIKYQIPILLYFPSEGFDFETYYWIDNIQKQFTERGLEKNQKFLIFGTGYETQRFYNEHIVKYSEQSLRDEFNDKNDFGKDFFELSHRSKMTRCFGVNFFEHFHYQKLKHSQYYTNKKYQKQLLEILNADNKTKNFVCLNRNLRYHRLALVSELIRFDLHKSNYVTLISSPEKPIPEFGECWKVEEYILKQQEELDHFKLFVKNFHPINSPIVEDDQSHDNLFLPPIQYYRETFFSLVTETEVSSGTLFLTEKITKAMSMYHPFLLLGCPYSLEYLRSLGYATFPEMFNEDYDKEEKLDKRFEMIMQEILKFQYLNKKKKIERFNSIKDKLFHNKTLSDERMKNITVDRIANSLNEILKIMNQLS